MQKRGDPFRQNFSIQIFIRGDWNAVGFTRGGRRLRNSNFSRKDKDMNMSHEIGPRAADSAI